MKITVIQPDILWEDPDGNLARLEKLVSAFNNIADIVILPEMFSTGFSMRPGELCDVPFGETYHWMKSVAKAGNFALCGSYITGSEGTFYNRWSFVTPNGTDWFYDKRHLFSMGGEDRLFRRGTERVVFKYRELRIIPAICYDIRFPVWLRNRNDYDIIICSANWPFVRQNVWSTLLKARAIENQCFVAASNRTGTDGEGIIYKGGSAVINPRGEYIELAGESEDTISADISLNDLNDFRTKFPVDNDADNFTLNI